MARCHGRHLLPYVLHSDTTAGVGANFFTWPEGVVDGRFDRELIALEVGNSVGNLDPVG